MQVGADCDDRTRPGVRIEQRDRRDVGPQTVTQSVRDHQIVTRRRGKNSRGVDGRLRSRQIDCRLRKRPLVEMDVGVPEPGQNETAVEFDHRPVADTNDPVAAYREIDRVGGIVEARVA